MADNLHLVLNERGNYNLVHEGRVYNLKRTNMEDKQWVCRRVKKGCRGSIYTNLDVNGILSSDSYADDCTPDNDILYKMEKKNALKRRAAEEMKTVPQIYHEEASSASADFETAGHFSALPSTRQQLEIPPHWRMTKSDRRFLLYTNIILSGLWMELSKYSRIPLVRSRLARFPALYAGFLKSRLHLYNMYVIRSPLSRSAIPLSPQMNVLTGFYCSSRMVPADVHHPCFYCGGKFVPLAAALGVALQPQTIICDFEKQLFLHCRGISRGPHTELFLPLLPVLRKVTDLGMRTSYIHEAATKKIVKMLLVMASLPLRDVPAAVELLGRDATGSVAALFNYFRVEWMPYNRLPLWNVYNVNIRTNNDLEGWHFKMNRLAGKRHLSFYELLQLLIDEQGSTETLIQQYEELQQRITALTAEYDGGTRTMEQFLGAVHLTYYLGGELLKVIQI
ncbi:hypothetical protein T12_715 [Trichinella patagoniensis]|uniref:FLYWCH-type domain-containing protein n=1 Tax=Trichinella patagoniensis TaxID=990121 RepID=A0A0V1A6Q3_9BILA|nr:hypothetical protein T12_715 [Trichinella patagoniensis]